MKVSFQYGLSDYTGKAGDIVYCFDRISSKVYARRYRYPTLTSENERVKNNAKGIFALLPSEAYKTDLRSYLLWYRSSKAARKKPLRSWVNVYMHLMYNMAKAYPDIDLKSITRDEIYSRDLPCICVKRAVGAVLLTPVEGWERMEQPI